MAIYVFSLLVGYIPNGVDNAQGIRDRYLSKLSTEVYYVYEVFLFESFKNILKNLLCFFGDYIW